MQDSNRKPAERSVDCDECRYGSENVAKKFNVARGRMCYKYSSVEERERLLKIGKLKVRDGETLVLALHEAEKANRSVSRPSNFETQCRTLNLCPWSFPVDKQELDAMWVISMSQSMNGITFPYPQLPLDEQPNLFFEFLSIFNKAKYDYSQCKFDSGDSGGK